MPLAPIDPRPTKVSPGAALTGEAATAQETATARETGTVRETATAHEFGTIGGGAVPDAGAPRASTLQLGIVVGMIVAYAALSHYSESTPDSKGLGAGLSIGPIVLIGAVLVWRWAAPLVAAACIAGGGALLYHYWPAIKTHFEWADLFEQSGAYALVAVGFVRSLTGGRMPMCTQLADRLHGPLEPVEIAYTRRATFVWAALYVLLAAAIVVLFFVAPLKVWSLFVNFATFGLIGIVFVTDHAIRRRVLPRKPGTGMWAALRQSLTGS